MKIDAPKLWTVLTRCQRVIALAAERDIADLGLCSTDFAVLEVLLHKGPLTISEIQAKVLLASGSMTAAVDRVESMGLIVRKMTAKDRRARILELTSQGRRLIEGSFAKHAQDLERIMSVLTAVEKRQLYEALKKLGHFVADQSKK